MQDGSVLLAVLLMVVVGQSNTHKIVGKYIARVNGSSCAPMRERVGVLKQEIQGASTASRDAPAKMRRIGASFGGVAETCFITFSGNTALQTEVAKQSGVMYVEQDQMVTLSSFTPSWGLDRVDDRAGLDNDYSPLYSGAGVKVYVIDSGIKIEHEEFQGRASFGADFINAGNWSDRNGHGTHVAGIVAGKTYGVAREASVVAVKAFSGQGIMSDVIAAMEYVTANAGRPSSQCRATARSRPRRARPILRPALQRSGAASCCDGLRLLGKV